MRLYLIYNYEEYGPENIFATTDKEKVLLAVKALQKEYERIPESIYENAVEALEKDAEGDYPLQSGWGGYVIHIVEDSVLYINDYMAKKRLEIRQ